MQNIFEISKAIESHLVLLAQKAQELEEVDGSGSVRMVTQDSNVIIAYYDESTLNFVHLNGAMVWSRVATREHLTTLTNLLAKAKEAPNPLVKMIAQREFDARVWDWPHSQQKLLSMLT